MFRLKSCTFISYDLLSFRKSNYISTLACILLMGVESGDTRLDTYQEQYFILMQTSVLMRNVKFAIKTCLLLTFIYLTHRYVNLKHKTTSECVQKWSYWSTVTLYINIHIHCGSLRSRIVLYMVTVSFMKFETCLVMFTHSINQQQSNIDLSHTENKTKASYFGMLDNVDLVIKCF